MRTASNEAGISVTISRLGNEPVTVTVPVDSTVAQALAKAGITLGSREELYVAGVPAQSGDILDDGDVLQVVTPKQAGAVA